jgi:hypothetical protein
MVQSKMLMIRLRALELSAAHALDDAGKLKCRRPGCGERAFIDSRGNIFCESGHGGAYERYRAREYARAVEDGDDLARRRELEGLAHGAEPQKYWTTVKRGAVQTREQAKRCARKRSADAEAAANRRFDATFRRKGAR